MQQGQSMALEELRWHLHSRAPPETILDLCLIANLRIFAAELSILGV
jgi:hypothetical protein